MCNSFYFGLQRKIEKWTIRPRISTIKMWKSFWKFHLFWVTLKRFYTNGR